MILLRLACRPETSFQKPAWPHIFIFQTHIYTRQWPEHRSIHIGTSLKCVLPLLHLLLYVNALFLQQFFLCVAPVHWLPLLFLCGTALSLQTGLLRVVKPEHMVLPHHYTVTYTEQSERVFFVGRSYVKDAFWESHTTRSLFLYHTDFSGNRMTSDICHKVKYTTREQCTGCCIP